MILLDNNPTEENLYIEILRLRKDSFPNFPKSEINILILVKFRNCSFKLPFNPGELDIFTIFQNFKFTS